MCDIFEVSNCIRDIVVEKGLNPEVVVHPKSLELLGQGEVSKDHVMNLGRNKSVFYQNEDQICYDTCCPDG